MPGPMPEGLTAYQENQWTSWTVRVQDRIRAALHLQGLSRRQSALEKELGEVRQQVSEAEKALQGNGEN